MSDPEPANPTNRSATTLSYRAPDGWGMMLVGEFSSVNMAELFAAELAAESIPARVLHGNTDASVKVDAMVYVRPRDASRATAILNWSNNEALEPAPEGGLDAPPTDAEGKPMPVAPVATFTSMRLLRDGELLLDSAGIESFRPRLVPRAQRPGLAGERFVLSVLEKDVTRGSALFRYAVADREAEVPRCPRCGTRKPRRVRHYWKRFAAFLSFTQTPAKEWECLICWHRGPTEDFLRPGE